MFQIKILKAHFYPESIRATLYTVFFFAKIDINESRNELGDDIIAHLARNKQLDKCAIDLAEHFDFDFLKNYRGNYHVMKTFDRLFRRWKTPLSRESIRSEYGIR